MRIVILSPELPYERVPHAGGEYLLRHVGALQEVHDVTLYVPGEPRVRDRLAEVPAWLPLVVTPFDWRRRYGMREGWYWLRRRTRFRALKVAAARGLIEADFISVAARADVVELQWIDSAIMAGDLRRAGVETPVVVVAHDVTALTAPALARLRAPAWRRPLLRWLERLRTRMEIADLNAADLVCVFKHADAAALCRLGVGTPTHVLEPVVDRPAAAAGPRDGDVVLFTGAMWREENQHGVEWFLRHVWPAVAAGRPRARFVVAGDAPPAWLVELAGTMPRVTVTGWVADMAPQYVAASLFVAPLFAPGGIKFKVPQAMAFHLPVVTTSVAVEGVDAPASALWAVTDDPAAMASAIVHALDHPAAAAAVGRAAGEWATSTYSFERATRRLIARYERLVTATGPGGPARSVGPCPDAGSPSPW